MQHAGFSDGHHSDTIRPVDAYPCHSGRDARHSSEQGDCRIYILRLFEDMSVWEASSQVGKPTAPVQERVREITGVVCQVNRDRNENSTPFDTSALPDQYI